jgi:23S rRNA (pseudouridine1915-N3)-methyltransferase
MLIGRTSSDYLRTGIDQYVARLSRYIPFEIRTLPDVKTTKSLTEQRQKETEGQAFLAQLTPGDIVVLLDERGREMTSREFSVFIEKKMVAGTRRLVFIVGGPYGFSQAVYDRADAMLSLSRMTFSHEMVRLFFVEQLYRAFTILNNEPYHHD